MTRLVVAALALLLLGWSAVLLRDARLQDRGTELAQPPQRPGELDRAERDLVAAGFLNPDSAPDVGRALVLNALGRGPEAVGVLDDVVRREPENLTAWRVLALITRDSDPSRSRRAAVQSRALDPLGSP